MGKQNKSQKRQAAACIREIHCPIHGRLIGKYDARHGVTNVTFYCPTCKKEYIFTRPVEKIDRKTKLSTKIFQK